MNTPQENRLSMYLAVRDFLLANREVTKELPNFETYFTRFQDKIAELQAIAEIQKSDTKGYARQKKMLRDILIEKTLDTSRRIVAFARFNQNLMLQSEVKITKSALLQATDTGLRDYARIIHDKALEYLEALTGYGITPDTQNQFLNAINDYNSSIAAPRVAKTETVKATRQLNILFEETDVIIENIDAELGIIKATSKGFYNSYKTARKIINAGAGTLALKGYAFETGTGAPISGVQFRFKHENPGFLAADEQSEIIKKTAEKGSFFIRNMPQGSYVVSVSKPGYRDKIVSVVVAEGEMTELKVELERI